MVFPAVSISAVASFLEYPDSFSEYSSSNDGDHDHDESENDNNSHNKQQKSNNMMMVVGDVARLLCVLYRHFRNGVCISQLKDALGNRRRTLIALHEACAAGLISIRTDSGNIKVI